MADKSTRLLLGALIFARAIVDRLSSRMVVLSWIFDPNRSLVSCCNHRASWTVADRAIYSASAVEIATQVCLPFLQLIAAPASMNTYPEVDFRSVVSTTVNGISILFLWDIEILLANLLMQVWTKSHINTASMQGVWNYALSFKDHTLCSAVVKYNTVHSNKCSIAGDGNHVQASPDILAVSGHTDLYTHWKNLR